MIYNILIIFVDDYTEELLEQHDNEVQRLQDYYQRHRLILDKVRQREELWTKFINFEVSYRYQKWVLLLND